MNYPNNYLLIISIALNILFLVICIVEIYRKGGILYIKNKISSWLNKSSNKIFEINSYYKHKKSQYEILPKSNNSIIFLGDSLTDEGEWLELLGNPNIKNRGISGDTITRILNRLDIIIETKPKQIFLMVGINDFANEEKSIKQVLEGYKTILNELKSRIPETQVFIKSVLPVNNNLTLFWHENNNIINFNTRLQELGKEFNYQYIDIFSHLADSDKQLNEEYTTDGLHLNGKAYLVWKGVIQKYVAVD